MIKKKNKKLIATSAISASLCAALLIGSSFAWFTDKVVNENNKIEAGTLDITAVAYGCTEDGSRDESNKIELENTNENFMKEVNWEPGQSNCKYIDIANVGSLAADVLVEFDMEGGDKLADALWAEVTVSDETSERMDIAELGTYFTSTLAGQDGFHKDGSIQVLPNTSVSLKVVYGMYEEAGNEYQNIVNDFTMDLIINAKQSIHEVDGFGSDQYDKEAEYDIPEDAVVVPPATDENGTVEPMTATKLNEIISNNLDGYIVLSGDIDLEADGESFKAIKGKFTGTFDGNGYTISNGDFANSTMFVEMEGATIKNLTLKNITATSNGNNVGLLGTANVQYEDTIISNVTIDNVYYNTTSTGALVNISSKGTAGVDRYQGTLIMNNVNIKDSVFRCYKGRFGLFVMGYDNGPKIKMTNCSVTNSYLDPGSNSKNESGMNNIVNMDMLAFYAADGTYIYDVDDATLQSIYNAYSTKSIFNDGSLGYGEDHTTKPGYEAGKITISFEEYKALVRKNVRS